MVSNPSPTSSSFLGYARSVKPGKTKPPRLRVAVQFQVGDLIATLRRLPRHPIPEVKIFPDFSAFVTVFLRFLRLIIHFAEWMFGILDCFTDDFQRFGHRLDLLLSGLARREGCQRAFLEERPPLHLLASAASSRLEYKTCFKDVLS